MKKYQLRKLMLIGWLGALPLAGCETLPGSRETQGAAVGGVAGALIGSQLGDESVLNALLGGALGAGAGYLIGANSDRLFGDNGGDARRSVSGAQTDPATVDDVRGATTADLNNDGFVTTDELVAMEDAGLSDEVMLRRLRATGQVFDLTIDQQNQLADAGISRNVLRQMPNINRAERDRLLSQRGEVIGREQ